MLDRIIGFSIRNKMVVGLFTIALILWGSYSVKQLPIDAVPDITNNQVQIITVSPSNGAEDIERLVTFPIEQTMATIPGIEESRSFSRFGLSVVTLVFKDNVDVYWARQQVNERLAEAKSQIPEGMGNPTQAPVTTGLGEIYQYTIHAKKGYEKKYNPMALRTIQDWIVRRQLIGTEGVADVSSFGGYLKQYEISLNPDKLKSMGISIGDVFMALKKNNQNTGGAYIDKKPNAYFIRSEGLIKTIDDIENIVIKNTDDGTPVLLRNVGTAQFGSAVRYGAMTRNTDGEVVGAIVMMLKGANSSKVIANVKERIAQISETLPEGVEIDPYLDRTKLVDNAISTVTRNLAEGALIVIFVLVLLLGNFRAGLIVASVIPLAMLFAIAMMNVFGVSGNLMSLGAIDFGLIVDGAVIIVEATMHHLSLRTIKNRLTQAEMDEEVYESASKIRSSAAFGEIIILIVYLPILALIGVEGKMFRPMAQTVSFAILGAFILSLTYVPMVSALFLNKNIVHKRNVSDRLVGFFQRIYTPCIHYAIKHRFAIIAASLCLFVLSLLVFNFLGAEFIPTLEEGDFAIETRVLVGSSLSQTMDTEQKAAKILLANFPEVKEIVGKIGSSEIPTDPMPVEACDMIVVLKEKSEWTSASSREELAQKMQAKLDQYISGVSFGFQQPIQMRFNELMTGARQDVVVKVFGENLDKLAAYASQIGSIARKIKGAEDVYVEEITGLPQIVIEFNRERIAQFGLNIEDINTAIRTGFAGEVAGKVYEGEKRFDLVVRLDKENRQNLDDIKNLFVTAPNGNQVPLDQLAEISFKVGPNQIQRDDAKRRVIVGFNVRGRDVESIVNEIKSRIDKDVKFDAGYYPAYGGTFENLQQARSRLSIAVPAALLLILVLLFLTFHSMKQALLILSAIPLSAIGGVFALWIRGMPFSISAGVGFIALFGVAVLNGIVLIAEFNRLKKEGMTDIKDIIFKGTATRLRPVLLTAFVASLGFLPMAISTGSGAEVQKPLATVVIGGLLSATLLTLLVLPVLYAYLEGLRGKDIKPVVTILLFFAGISSGFSQTQPVSLDQAIQQALQNNKIISASSHEVQYNQQLKRTATELPKTDVTLMYGQYNSIIKNDNNITVAQSIPFPTVFTSQNKLGRSQVKGAEIKLAATKNELAYQVKQVYYQLTYEQAQRQLLLIQDSLYERFLQSAARRYQTGEAKLLEKTTAEMQRNEIKNLLSQNSANISIYSSQLKTLMNSPTDITITETDLKARDMRSLLDSSAVKNNPALAYIRQQIEINGLKKNVELARALPDFRIGYFNQTLIGNQVQSGQEVYFGPSRRFQGIIVGLSVPIWFVPNAAKVKAANINTQIAADNLAYYQTGLQAQYVQAVQEYLKNKNSLDYYNSAALPNANLILKQSQSAYGSGDISYAEYLLAVKNANGIKEGYLQTLNAYNQSVVTLEYLSGKNQ